MSFELEPKHRRAIRAGEAPDIHLTAEQALEVKATTVTLEHNLTVEILTASRDPKVKGKERTWRLVYKVRDFRALHLRRGGGVTRSVQQAVDNAGDPVSKEWQSRITTEAHGRFAEREAVERAEELARKQARAVNESVRGILIQAAKTGADVSGWLATLQRANQEVTQRMEDEAA